MTFRLEVKGKEFSKGFEIRLMDVTNSLVPLLYKFENFPAFFYYQSAVEKEQNKSALMQNLHKLKESMDRAANEVRNYSQVEKLTRELPKPKRLGDGKPIFNCNICCCEVFDLEVEEVVT